MVNSESTRRYEHVGLIISGNINYAKKKSLAFEQLYEESFKKILEIIHDIPNLNLSIFSIHVLPTAILNILEYPIIACEFEKFIDSLNNDPMIMENNIKVTVIGKWYELSGTTVELIKNVMEKTNLNSSYQLNLLVNYDGNEEILDSCKNIARKIKTGKLDPESISRDIIKENLYLNIRPPDIIIKTGKSHRLNNFLLWDIGNAKIIFTEKYWLEIEKKDILHALE